MSLYYKVDLYMGFYQKVGLYTRLYRKVSLYKSCTYIPPSGEYLPLQVYLFYPTSHLQEVAETLNSFSGFPVEDGTFSSKFSSLISFFYELFDTRLMNLSDFFQTWQQAPFVSYVDINFKLYLYTFPSMTPTFISIITLSCQVLHSNLPQ